jgi:uncharacterized protein (DUF952 family)
VTRGEPAAGLFHLALPDDWHSAVRVGGTYAVSSRGRTLAEEGFIHLATRLQVAGVVERYYADVRDHVLVLTIDPVALDTEVRFEAPEGGTESFPHLYGPLPLHAVTAVERLSEWSVPSA